MFMYILYEDNASTWSHNQFILLVMHKWTEDCLDGIYFV